MMLCYLGPADLCIDPTSGTTWQRGAAKEVGQETVERLLHAPGQRWSIVSQPRPATVLAIVGAPVSQNLQNKQEA